MVLDRKAKMESLNSFFFYFVLTLTFLFPRLVYATLANGLEEKLEFTIEEGVPRGSVVGRIKKREGYSYRLNERNRFFAFNSTSGEILTLDEVGSALLDREALERYGYKRDEVDFVILGSASQSAITPAAYFIAITVHVTDINDNAPTFPFPFQNVSLAESARVGTRLILASATDADVGENGSIKEYDLINGNQDGVFQLKRGGEESSPQTVLLELLKPLDRETKSLYIVNISAVDGGKPALFGFLTVFINVLDSNDNQPIFDRQQYTVSVSETLPAGSSILLISAIDKDSGENARISYSIGNDVENQFRINPETGVISSNTAPLKCPEMRSANSSAASRICTFTVEANDHGVPAQRARTFVNVELFDVNDHAPEITFRYYSAAGNGAEMAAVIEETKPMGTVVAVVTVNDPDHGENGKTTVAMVKGNEMGHFRLESNELFSVVRTNSTLKRTVIDKYNLTIMASDRGNPPKFTFKNMLIYVNDASDQPPVFDRKVYNVKIPENSPLGAFVVAVRARLTKEKRTLDECEAGIWYDVINGTNLDSSVFRLDHRTGLIAVAGQLDFDEASTSGRNFTLVISAKDACRPSLLKSTTLVKIELTDVNDQAPRFARELYNVTIFENASIGTPIMKLEAHDGDSGENGRMSYSFAPAVNQSQLDTFSLDSASGQITLSTLLDRERINSYQFRVIASDHGSPSLTGSTIVHIGVLDVNDNSPKFLRSEYYANVRSFDPAGTKLTRIYAEDPDEGWNGEITYFFLVQPPVSAIALSQKTGDVYLKGRMALPEGTKRLEIVMGASDGGGSRAPNNATLHVYVVDGGGLPVFTKDNYTFRIQEDPGFGGADGAPKSIGTVSATDADNPADNSIPIQYKIVEGDQKRLFDIGQYSGELRSTRKVDYEEASRYKLTVAALGKFGVTMVEVKIDVEDVNDNAPRFETNETKLIIERRWPAGNRIHTAKATDADSGLNGMVRYTLKDGDGNKYFGIDQTSGTLYLITPAYLIKKNRYPLTIVATDSGSPPLSTLAIIHISVLDNDPRSQSWFERKWYDFEVWENTMVNTPLIRLNLTKPCNQNDTMHCIFYVEDQLENDEFGVFPDGWLYVKNELDYETRTSFTVNVGVRQVIGDATETTSTSVINLRLVDQNDNAPRCISEKFQFQLPEHAESMTYVGTVTAEDSDSGLAGCVTYRLIPDSENYSSYFNIDPSTGDLIAIRSFDLERLLETRGSPVLNVLVAAADFGDPQPNQVHCKVQVEIVDVNDHPPRFALDVYAVSIPENEELGSEIIRVSANDADEGENGAVEFMLVDGDDEARFWMNGSTGQLILRRPLDWEEKDVYVLTLMARDFGKAERLNSTAHIVVYVLDINDNSPTFINFPYSIIVSELAPIGSLITILNSTDSDSGPAGSVRYALTKGNQGQNFELDPVTGALWLVRPLDFENRRNFTLTIWASDQGTPSLANISEITINILDENDNAPVITSSILVSQVPAQAPVGTKIFTVTASDQDTGLNGTVRFRLADQKPSVGFNIDERTGIISVASALDFESTDVYNLLVEAVDSCENTSLRLSTRRMITVLLIDDQSNPLAFGGPTAIVVNPENQKANLIGNIKPNPSGKDFSYSLVDGEKETFDVTGAGDLVLERPLDNSRPIYKLKIAARAIRNMTGVSETGASNTLYSDYSILSCFTTSTLQFDKSRYEFRIGKNSLNGTEIGRVKVMGNAEYYVTKWTLFPSTNWSTDGGQQGQLLFDVDHHTGLLYSTGVLRQKMFKGRNLNAVLVEVTAVDSSKPGSCARSEVIVQIDQESNSVLRFSEYFYQFQVEENAVIGTAIGLVKLLDSTSAVESSSRSVQFSIVNSSAVPFDLNSKTGALTTSASLDREQTVYYDFEIQITDGRTTGSASVHVDVLDVNDNQPEFGNKNDTDPSFHFKIMENSQKNTFVGRVVAMDNDAGANGEVEYTSVNPELRSFFSLDSSTGVVRVNRFIDREEYAFFLVEIQASDRGNPPKSSKTIVWIEMIDANDNPPVLDRSFYEVNVYENTTQGAALLQLAPWDYDIDSDFSFSIVSGNVWSQFSIDDNGTLTVAAPLNRETRSVYHLVVSVYDQPRNVAIRHSTNAQITINILDINDCSPRFVSPNWASVSTSAAWGTLLTTVRAVDSDEGLAGFVNYLLDPNSAGVFSLDPVSGDLRLTGDLSKGSNPKIYNLSIWAYDHGEPKRSTNLNLTIFVLYDGDTIAPSFQEKFMEISVPEDAAVGSTLTQLKISNGEKEQAAVRYWVLGEMGDGADLVVWPNTGIVSVARALDYERKSRYNLTVAVANWKSKTPADLATVVVHITDVNDNPPRFLQSPVYLDILEGNWTGRVVNVGVVAAIDADSGANGKLSYSIIQGNTSIFSIDSLNGELKMQGQVDREITPFYLLTVEVADSGSPRRSATTSVNLTVLDVNDNDPIFDKPAYVGSVLENKPVGVLVLRVSATDADEGENGLIRYRLDSAEKLPFSMDEITGEITTKASLDREIRSEYSFDVVATDSSIGEPRTSRVRVTIRIEDANDNAPVFTDTAQDIYVSSAAANGELVYVVGAEDADEGDNARLRYSLAGRDAKYFDMVTDTGVIRWKSPGPGELQNDYSVDIFVSDLGKLRAQNVSTSLRFFPRLDTDFPVFTKPTVGNFSILENATDQEITRVSAHSPKQNIRNLVTYAISAGNFGEAFEIDALTGRLSSTSKLDYELRQHYELYVAATDDDNPPLVAFHKIIVNVEDCNDNAPMFRETSYSATVLEEEAAPLPVVRVTATDADSGRNGKIRYAIRDDQPNGVADLFDIDSDTGSIVTKTVLDREKWSKYRIMVEATDDGTSRLSAIVPVVVNVADVNDNAPKFTRLFTGTVQEDATVGAVVTQVTSSDPDSTPENSNNTYYLSVNPGDKFGIDPKTGVVTVNGGLDRETQSEHQLKVVAIDGAWKVETSLTVNVLDVNDNAPVFTRVNYTFVLSELEPALTVIGTVEANDTDEPGPNSKVTYRILEKSSLFLIDSQTGELRTARPLPRTMLEPNFYNFIVVAEDAGRPILSTAARVTVKLVGRRDRIGLFRKKSMVIAIPVDIPKGFQIANVASYVDEMEKAKITYVLHGRSEQFAMESQSETIFAIRQMSNSIGTQTKLTVVARDATSSAILDTLDLTLVVTDVNKRAPEFSSSSYSIAVSEDSSPGTAIFTVSARDYDEGLNGKVTYACVRNRTRENVDACDLFIVDEDTGVISLMKKLDYEIANRHSLVLSATDGGLQPKTAFATLLVTVQDVNDNAPVFIQTQNESAILMAHIEENCVHGSPVFQLRCTDADSPPYNTVKYTIEEGADGKFVVNESSGLISVTGDIDYEIKSVYRLHVKCGNPDSAGLASTAVLVVYVDGQDEYQPQFEKSLYEFEVDSMMGDGAVVGTVKAIDGDAGPDGVVFYSIQFGGDGGLAIGELTGEIRVHAKPTEHSSVVTVYARNRRLMSSSEIAVTQVRVSFSPGKPSAPVFPSKTIYVEMTENAPEGTTVLKLNATSSPNPIYELYSGDEGDAFYLDSASGVLHLKRTLDRETLDGYSLVVRAYGGKNSSAFSTATVMVSVLDVNDNAPYLTEPASVGYILENEPSGTAIMTLIPTDDDLPPNKDPFTFTLLDSNASHLFYLDPSSGVLRSKAVFDRESQDRYVLPVKIMDGGKPTLWTVSNVTVLVKDVNDSPCTDQSIRLTVLAVDSVLPAKLEFGAVYPADIDSVGDYACKSRMENNTKPMIMIEQNCVIASADPIQIPGIQKLWLMGTDGLHGWVNYDANMEFEKVDNDMVTNSITVRVRSDRGKLAKTFVEWVNDVVKKWNPNEMLFSKILYVTPLESVFDDSHEISLVILDQDKKPVASSRAGELLDSMRLMGHFSNAQFEIKSVFKGFCTGPGANSSIPCKNGGTCVDLVNVDKTKYNFITEENITLSFPSLTRSYRCDCPSDFTGANCETPVDQCASHHCSNGGTCVYRREQSKLECVCPDGFTGPMCQEDTDECKMGINGQPACLNNGWCENTKGGYRCLCMVGYTGPRCQNSTSYCATEPCQNGGKCILKPDGYSCLCEFGFTGKDCKLGSRGFEEASYMEIKNNGEQLDFEFSTIRSNALLVFGYDGKTKDGEYMTVDIMNGRVRLLGVTTDQNSIIKSKSPVNKGQWHKVEIMRIGKELSISVVECTRTECAACPKNDKSCQLTATLGERQSLFPGSSVSFGTVRDFDRILWKAGQLSAPGFVGCIRNIKMNGVEVDQTGIISQDHVLDYCPRSWQPPCSGNRTNSCGEGEKCQDAWSKPVCSCQGGFSSSNCKTADTAASFSGSGFISYQLAESYRRRLLFASTAPSSQAISPEDSYRFKRLATAHYPKQWIILEFRTMVTDGLLFFAMSSNDEFSLIDIVNGTVRYVSRSKESVPMQVSLNDGPFVADGEWHLVSLALQSTGNQVEFRIDNFGKDAKSSSPLHWIVSADLAKMSLGGVQDPVKVGGSSLRGFNGCLRKFIVNGVLQPLHRGDVTFFESKPIGDVQEGCGNSAGCSSPPCSGPPATDERNNAKFNGGVVAVLVFFACMIISTVVAYLVVKRIRQKKCGKTNGMNERTAFVGPGASSVANISTLSNIIRSKQHSDPANLNGSIKDSGIVLGISRQTLDGSQVSLNDPVDAHGTAPASVLSASTYLNNYLTEEKRTNENGNFNRGRSNGSVEKYDLDDASSMAPSDADVAKHYRDFRQYTGAGDGFPRKLPSRFIPPPPPAFTDSTVPSLFGPMYASAHSLGGRNRKSPGLRATPNSVLAMMPESESSDDVMMQRTLRSQYGQEMDSPEIVWKGKPETATRSMRSRQRRHVSAGERRSGKWRRSNRSSTKSKSRRRQDGQERVNEEESSDSAASSSDSTLTARGSRPVSRRSNSATPRILSGTGRHHQQFNSQRSSTNDDYSDCATGPIQQEFDLDQVRKPRRFLQLPEDTETESDINAMTGRAHSTRLDQFIPGPRTLFLMSEDDTTTDAENDRNGKSDKAGIEDLATGRGDSQNQKEGLEAFV